MLLISLDKSKNHYGSVILVDSLGRTDLPLYISEVRGYECGRVGSKLAHLSAKAATQVSEENYLQIGRPIPGSSWSRVVQFAGSDTTFVHVITPYFHADGDVSMMMPRDDIK